MFNIACVVSIVPLTLGGIGLKEATFLYAAKMYPALDQELGIMIATISFILCLASSSIGPIIIFFTTQKSK